MTGARYPDLAGRSAVVTGGATGIGAAVAVHLATQGVRVTVLDVDAHAGRALAAETASVRFDHVDVTDTAALGAAFDAAGAWAGPVTLLVANAADDARHDFDALAPEDWDRGFTLNLRHQAFSAQFAARQMAKAGNGAMVTMGSVAWRMAAGGMVGYLAAKAGVEGLTRGLARELGPRYIRVNCVVPGWIMTEKQLRLWVTPEAEQRIDAAQCLPRRLVPEDVARVVTFLLSAESGGCTAQSFIVDGGWV
jgi:D-xylose 1-dehydrogenase